MDRSSDVRFKRLKIIFLSIFCSPFCEVQFSSFLRPITSRVAYQFFVIKFFIDSVNLILFRRSCAMELSKVNIVDVTQYIK